MEVLPSALALLLAALLAAPVTRLLVEARATERNFRGAQLPRPLGLLAVVAGLLALGAVAALDELAGLEATPAAALAVVAPYALGVALLGLADDLLATPPRGWRGHGAALRRGELSTGVLKAVGALALALAVLADRGLSAGEYVLAVLVLVLATNLLNLVDLRPGRSVKVLALVAVGVTLGAWDLGPLAAVGAFAAPLLVCGVLDLRERGMLGDTGANLAGACAGLLLVLTLSTTGLVVALCLLLAVTAYAEMRSLSALVERAPVLRHLDSIGRSHG